MKRIVAILGFVVLSLPAATGILAQSAGSEGDDVDAPGRVRLRAAMQEYFQKRLRTELSLTDEQLEDILPRVNELEQTRREGQRSRADSVRELRHGLDRGASDAVLDRELERLERTEREQWERERSIMKEIDKRLTTRQRVQLRFFMQRFRREMQDKVRELRRDGPRAHGPGAPAGRHPRRQNR